MLNLHFMHNHNKFMPRVRAYIFLGYSVAYKGYNLLDLQDHKIQISKHVIFYETIFPIVKVVMDATQHDFFFDRVVHVSLIHSLPCTSTSNQSDVVTIKFPSHSTCLATPTKSTKPHRTTKSSSYSY